VRVKPRWHGARDISLRRLTKANLSNAALPFTCSHRLTIGGVVLVSLRVFFTSDLSWELYCPADARVELYRALLNASRKHPAGPVGARCSRYVWRNAMASEVGSIPSNTGG
jgi:glycine cleavage system aminomethyltransferase T